LGILINSLLFHTKLFIHILKSLRILELNGIKKRERESGRVEGIVVCTVLSNRKIDIE